MKTLKQSLIDFDSSMLNAIASRRGLLLESSNKNEVIDHLIDAMLSPINLALAIDEMTIDEQAALNFVIKQGGQVEAARFIRQFGAIRPMGPARLEREQPWQTPINPAEGLWYSGLIFRAFQVREIGGTEFFYIPSDLFPLMQDSVAAQASVTTPPQTLSSAPIPTNVLTSAGRLRENFFSLLVYLQTHPVRKERNGELSATDTEALHTCVLPPPPFVANELDFLLHVGLRTSLLTIMHGKLRPNRVAARNWLQTTPTQQDWQLQNGWRADPGWNDLWQIPDLFPQPTGWENSPLRARSKILAFLDQLPANTWFYINDFVAYIKETEPDFQRPDGDYTSWYIKDSQGALLMGFEHWDTIEGNLIKFIITNILFSLSTVDLGSGALNEKPTHFRVTEAGNRFLAGAKPDTAIQSLPAPFRVDEKSRVRVPAHANLLDRFQVARFAVLSQREENRTIYLISQASVSRALQNGVTHDQITAFLNRVTNNQIPLKVIEQLRRWGTRLGTARLENVALLRVAEPQMLTEIQQIPEIAHLLGEILGTTAIIVPDKNVAIVRKTLREHGYLEY
jgi:hypothetical protein